MKVSAAEPLLQGQLASAARARPLPCRTPPRALQLPGSTTRSAHPALTSCPSRRRRCCLLPALPLQEPRPSWAAPRLNHVCDSVCRFLHDATDAPVVGKDGQGRDVVRLAAMPKTAVVHAQVRAPSAGAQTTHAVPVLLCCILLLCCLRCTACSNAARLHRAAAGGASVCCLQYICGQLLVATTLRALQV